jgi:hypothetical protein
MMMGDDYVMLDDDEMPNGKRLINLNYFKRYIIYDLKLL